MLRVNIAMLVQASPIPTYKNAICFHKFISNKMISKKKVINCLNSPELG